MKVGPSSALIWLVSSDGRHHCCQKNAPPRLARRTRCFSLSYQPIVLSPAHPKTNTVVVETTRSSASALKTPTLAKSSGVTSLVHFPLEQGTTIADGMTNSFASHQVLVGTKLGDVAILRFFFNVGSQEPRIEHIATLPSAAATRLNLPIFSLAVEKEETTDTIALYVGGGDRYVTVWRQQHQNDDSWVRPTQRLGPHTGWVKSIMAQFRGDQFRQRRRYLYSIGCNRIETWERVNAPHDDDNLDGAWTHAGTISVDSSPVSESSGACTLSSDLLCLASCDCRTPPLGSTENATAVSVLAAGGVDGRIHFFWEPIWNDNVAADRGMRRACAVAAHQGRVKALQFDPEQQLLLSVSHDGSVRCWSLSIDHHSEEDACRSPTLSVHLVASLAFDADTRVTALAWWRQSQGNAESVNVAVGTHHGLVCVLSLRAQDNSCEATSRRSRKLYDFVLLQKLQIAFNSKNASSVDRPTINALCPLLHGSDTISDMSPVATTIVVGHSVGLGFVVTTF